MSACPSRLAVAISLAVAVLTAIGCKKPKPRETEIPPPTSPAPTSRTLSFTNQCPFDVWIQSVGSNAANIPCSASTTSAQANCPTGFVCYAPSTTTQYCVPGSATSSALPLTAPAQITLVASGCPSGALVTDPASAQWGQCTCTGNAGCAANQVCGRIDSTTSQCFWGFTLANGGHLGPAAGGANTGTIAIAVGAGASNAIVASGNFFAKLSCDANGNCLSDSDDGSPATRIEYTLANDLDFYDVSYINGMNVPAVMTPVPSTSLAYLASDPYRCTAAGGDATTLQGIASFQRANQLPSNTALQAFACTNDYATTFVGGAQGLNFVSTTASPTSCSSASDCTGGAVCGLTLGAVTGATTVGQLTCGQRLGYWTYAQLCGASSSFASSALGVDCADPQTLAYAECTNQSGVTDQGPGRSCFNSNTTTKGDTCCGFSAWTFGGKAQPMAVGTSAVAGVDTSFWTSKILPVVTGTKAGCPLAYAFQFDDPYATFTCTTGGSPNGASYQITLCPNGATGGVAPPPPPTCTATVPSGFQPAQFTISAPASETIAVAACDAAGANCSTTIAPDSGTSNIYTATGSTVYQITATSGAAQQVCQFTIPTSGCITRFGPSGPPCSTWDVATVGAWIGRSVAPPSFSAAATQPGARTRRSPTAATQPTGGRAPSGRSFDRDAAEVALLGAANTAHSQCPMQGVAGVKGKVEVTFSPAGPVSSVRLPDAWQTSGLGACVEAIFAGLRVEPFDGAAVTLSQGVDVP